MRRRPFTPRLRAAWRVGALLTLILAGAGAWTWHDLTTPVVLSTEVVVAVPAGAGFAAVVAKLGREGVVAHALPLRLWARWNGFDRQMQSGDFRFVGPLSPLDVLSILRSPANALHRVTIPEGTTVRGVVTLLAAAGFGGADVFQCLAEDPEFLGSLDLPASGLEGYLFPDTYEWAWSAEPEIILRAMVQRFRSVTAALDERRRARGVVEADMVTLASIVEKETGVAAERRLVAAVFRNRLRLGMRLQSDPTTVYGRDDAGVVPRHADLLLDTPYNTYLHGGLPPGPICNPGLAAMEAALEPADTPYLYFVARNDGGHEFTLSLEEHNRAVERYRRK